MTELTTFDLHKLAQVDVQTKDVEGLGTISFGRLTMRDLADIKRAKDEIEQSYLMLHRMLVKANPDLTLEEIAEWDPVMFAKIFQALVDVSDFRGPRSENGSG